MFHCDWSSVYRQVLKLWVDSVPWHMLEARVFGNATEAWLDGVLVATGVSDQPPLPNGHSALIVVSDNAQFDDVRWRKFAAQEPTIQIGKAETKTAQSAHWLSDTRPAPAYAPTSQPVAPASDSPVLVVLAALFTVISVGIVGVGFARSRG